MSEHLVRVENLKALQAAKQWSDSDLARACERTPQQVHAWFKNARPIGEKLARDLEERLGLARFALDERGTKLQAQEPPPSWGSVRNGSPSGTKTARELPAFEWAQAGRMFDARRKMPDKQRTLTTLAPASSAAAFVEMPDDSMEPVFSAGDHVLFDPAETPRAGDVVLVKNPLDEHFVRVFKPRRAGLFDAVSLNENYQALSSVDDGVLVVAVMVEHRRYRRAP